jgi:endonuclease/exonuclease/phosphatase family metal-dependent hydrolase
MGFVIKPWFPALVAALIGASSCAHRPNMAPRQLAASCHQVVPDSSRTVTWIAPDDSRDLGRLVEWCRTVGPLLVESPAAAPAGPIDELAILTWNVHVGGGDLESMVARLRSGEFTDGRPMPHFVMLLQETHRQGRDVPAELAAGAPVPRAIVEQPPTGIRRDVADVARGEGLHVFYAPSMRNQRADAAEDRGTAILSTIPLDDLQVIELPFERQRRVALAATVAGRDSSGGAWRLRVADIQIDTALALTRGGPFAARRRQAEAFVQALTSAGDRDVPTIVGGDFNTWLGPKEPALEVMRRAFPDSPSQTGAVTWRGPLGARAALDYVFARGSFDGATTRRLRERFGSDHYPLLTVVRRPQPASAEVATADNSNRRTQLVEH